MGTQIIALDCESSGLAEDSYPISIGVYGDSGLRSSWLIEPLVDWTHWCENAEMIHGINRETLIEVGRDPWLVARELNSCFKGLTLYCDSDWDKVWVAKLFDDVDVKMAFNLVNIYDILNSKEQSLFVDEMARLERSHVADEDAEDICNVYKKVKSLNLS